MTLRKDTGELLNENIEIILSFYSHIASCVCFLGEGEAGDTERNELLNYAEKAHGRGFKCCLYSGRDTVIEGWMHVFDYVKIGSYKKGRGPISSPTTNQRMYKNISAGFVDMTKEFW